VSGFLRCWTPSLTWRIGPGALPIGPLRGEVDFEHVIFRYEDDEPVLEDVSIHAAPGDRIALVGETGAGKSTVIRLLAVSTSVQAACA
jgi:ABC-type multidrug transport system fused ATPase/permease subunit